MHVRERRRALLLSRVQPSPWRNARAFPLRRSARYAVWREARRVQRRERAGRASDGLRGTPFSIRSRRSRARCHLDAPHAMGRASHATASNPSRVM